MPLIRDEALVLTRLDYSENSQILVLFTREHGKVRAMAKGIKRGTRTRFAAGIDLLDVGSAVLSSRQEPGESLSLLTEWKQTRMFGGLREKLFRLDAAQYIAELTAHLTEDGDPAVALFDVVIGALAALAEAQEPFIPILGFQLALLNQLGAMPRFDACVSCGRDLALTHFSSLQGGMLCGNCEPRQAEKRGVSSATRAILQRLTVELDGPQIPVEVHKLSRPPPGSTPEETPPDLGGPFALLNYHLSHLMGREPMMAARLLPKRLRRKGP